MRVYIPTTVIGLRTAIAAGQIGPGLAYAVTPGLRSWAGPADDVEELEFVALNEAARQCLRMLAGRDDEPPARVVLAADLPDSDVVVTDRDPGEVTLVGPVPIAAVASAHVDSRAASRAVAAAAVAVGPADAGDAAAEAVVDAIEELLWYAPEELAGVASEPAGP
jgi:hypothetical protein